jgi:hypothetical protein
MICLEYMQTQCSEYLDFMGPKLQQLSIQIVHVKSITRLFCFLFRKLFIHGVK